MTVERQGLSTLDSDSSVISAKDTLELMARLAPKAWCKRVLLQLISVAQLNVIVAEGRITCEEHDHSDDEHTDEGYEKSEALSVEKTSYGVNRYVFLVEEWSSPQILSSPGIFDLAQEIKWDEGILSTDFIDLNNVEYVLNIEQDHCRKGIKFELKGLYFDVSQVEMLVPTVDIPDAQRVRSSRIGGKIGAPQKWDWEGALICAIKLANKPDGIEIGAGAQAKLERALADWFVEHFDASPATSEIRLRASRIISALTA